MIDENLVMAREVKRAAERGWFLSPARQCFSRIALSQGVDFICIGEYEYTVLELLQGKPPQSIAGLFPNAPRPLLDVRHLPWPEDTDVSRMAYAIPGEPSSEFREVQMYASRGCPGSCNFCVARHVYYRQPNWRPRDPRDVVAEIAGLKKKYPQMEGVFFDEEVHNGSKDFILELSRAIVAAGLQTLHYEAMCDIRFIDSEVAQAMKAAGYYKVRIGIETASEQVMKSINKNIDPAMVRKNLGVMKNAGLRTYGTFTFGALGANKYEDEKTIVFMRQLINEGLLDNLQLSICTPQPGTPFYRAVREAGFLRETLGFEHYDGGSCALIEYPGYKAEEIKAVKQRALIIRDHCLLMLKLRNKHFLRWIRAIAGRHGVRGLWGKALRRIVLELKYLISRR
jgi:Fe-S oxidoreductase